MLFPIHVCQIGPLLPHVLLQRRIHGQFFADCVTRQCPGQLVPPLRLRLDICGIPEVINVAINGFVVIAYCVRDGLVHNN